MQALAQIHARAFGTLDAALSPILLPTLARFLFVASLFGYYWNSGLTKTGDGLLGLVRLDTGAYIQILPRVFDAVGYDPSALGPLARAVVLLGTWAEFILPLLLLAGLFTRLAALGMIGFVVVQTWVDVMGHGAALGAWFDRHADGLIDDRGFWLFPLILLVLKGAGPLSVDALLARRQSPSAPLTPASQPR
ncbi:DoxX family membrane protein [Rhodobacterales bacterium HKCCSP123]|nr:DoxX family membrane protein [Rhodobacterales bacterium HKCCSP123]